MAFKIITASLLIVVGATTWAVAENKFEIVRDLTPRDYDAEKSLLVMPELNQAYVALSLFHVSNNTNGDTFRVTDVETDSLSEQSNTGMAGFTAGFDHLNLYENATNTWLEGFSYGFLFHVSPKTFKGEVYQFQSPSLNNYNYTLSVTPIDLAADVKWFIGRIPHTEALPYVMIGAGLSAVHLTYDETPRPLGDVASSGSRTSYSPLGLIGFGVEYGLPHNWFMATQYLFHYRSTSLDVNVPRSPSGFSMHMNEHSVDLMVGYRW